MSRRERLRLKLALRLLWRSCPTDDELLLGAMTDLATTLQNDASPAETGPTRKATDDVKGKPIGRP